MANLEFYLHYRLGHREQFNTANMKQLLLIFVFELRYFLWFFLFLVYPTDYFVVRASFLKNSS